MSNPTISHSKSGDHTFHSYYDNDAKLSREDGPAYIAYDKNNYITFEMYCLHGQYHSLVGPSVICYIDDKINSELYYIHGDFFETYKEYYAAVKLLILK